MGLSTALARFAYGRPHLLLVEGPGGTAARLAVEQLARHRGWPLVDTAADADLLVSTGGSELDEHLDRVWDQLPGPRARLHLGEHDDAASALEQARLSLLDRDRQRADVRTTERPGGGMDMDMDMDMGGGDPHAGHDMGGMGGMDMGGGEADPHAGHDMGGMGMSGGEADPHAGHDMGGMGMSGGEADPHAGHDMGGMDGMDTGGGEPDPHAGHDMGGGEADPHAGHDMGGMDMGGGKPDPHAGHDMGGMAGMDMGGGKPDPHAGHDMGGMDMGGGKPDPHAGHDMGGMGGGDPHAGHDMGGMQMPAGLAMADRAPDRDGLKLDVLTVPFGPVLPWWPAGLVVTTVLQGDVVQSADVELIGDAEARRAGWAAALADLAPTTSSAVVRLDALGRLLGVAGWDRARLQSQRVRDALLRGARVDADLQRLARRVAGARTLARTTSGVRTTGGEDVVARYRRWLQEAEAAVLDAVLPPPVDAPHVLHALPDLLVGTDVTGLRLVVASVDLELSGAASPAVAGV